MVWRLAALEPSALHTEDFSKGNFGCILELTSVVPSLNTQVRTNEQVEEAASSTLRPRSGQVRLYVCILENGGRAEAGRQEGRGKASWAARQSLPRVRQLLSWNILFQITKL